MMKICFAIVLAALAIAPFQTARAAQFEIVYKSCPDDYSEDLAKLRELPTTCNSSTDKIRRGRIAVRLVGDIASGDAERLNSFLALHVDDVATFGYSNGGGSYVTVYLAGETGNTDAAIELGRFFKDNAVQTRIAHDARCAGPCALAFMGGRVQWGRLTRVAVDRRLEAGGQLVFNSPFFAGGDGATQAEQLRDQMRSVQSYAAHVAIPPLVLVKILALKDGASFAIDNVFWAKLANITVDGILPVKEVGDDDYISACLSQADWTYGLRGEYGEPPKLRDDKGNWEEGEVVYSGKNFVIVAVVWSFSRYDYWCAINATQMRAVKIPRERVRAILRKRKGRNTLLFDNSSADIDLKGNQIYFSKAPTDFADTRAMNSLDLLLRSPETKLAAIADPQFKWNAWSDWDPWFEHDQP
jgi:hypothetical protein